MAAIAAANVTYTPIRRSIGESGYRERELTITFGNGTLTYPAGGIPLTPGNLGCPNEIRVLNIYGSPAPNGFTYSFDTVLNTIHIYAPAGTAGAQAELATSATPAAASLNVQVVGW